MYRYGRTIASVVAFITTWSPHGVAGPEVRVLGEARTGHLQVHRVNDGLELRGSVVDDLGRPLPGFPVHIEAPQAPANTWGRPCATPTAPERPLAGLEVRSDDQGLFCILLAPSLESISSQIQIPTTELYSGTQAPLQLTPAVTRLNLEFERALLEVPLEEETYEIRVLTTSHAAGPSSPEVDVSLSLQNGEDVTPLGLVRDVLPGDTVRFQVNTNDLGPPGQGQLRASFGSNNTYAPSEARAVLRRQVRVSLQALQAPEELEPHTGTRVLVRALSSTGAIPKGSVEARLNGHPVDAALLEAGVAQLTFTPPDLPTGQAELVLRFLPADPWWLASASLQLKPQVQAPSGWRSWPWFLLGLLVTAWFVRAWQRPAARQSTTPRASAPSGQPELRVLREDGASQEGWRGEILDAHDGYPIIGATVMLCFPSFSQKKTVQSVTTGQSGEFRLKPIAERVPEGATLLISAAEHADLERPLPKSGSRLRVQLVNRRRSLLKELTSWAQKRAMANAPPNPTPGQVVVSATRQGDEAVGSWAQAVQEAAYGPDALDEHRHARVKDKRPERF